MKHDVIPYEFITSERLTIDYVNHTRDLTELFPRHFKEPSIRKFQGNKQEIVKKLLAYNQKIDVPKQVTLNIEALNKPETFAVITGQQPGIFSGPLYTIYKAMSTIVLCERLSSLKQSFVPIFWNASEDHDISEVNHITTFKQNEPFTIYYNSESRRTALSHLNLDKSELKRILTIIDCISPDSEFKKPLLNEITRIVQISSTVGEFFSRFMIFLLGDMGLVMIEPHYLRELMIPIFEKLVRKPTECTRILAETGLQLSELGYSPKIHKKSDICNFFILNEKGKRLQVKHEGKFRISNETFSERDILDLLEENPSRFSANAITRPVIQDFLFPTFAYVAGPNEIAYYAQLKGVYDFFSVEMPVIFPRFGATITENKISKTLAKFKAKINELKDPEKLLKRIASERIDDVFSSFKGAVSKGMTEVIQRADSIDPTLIKPCFSAKGKIFKTIEVLEGKIASKLKQHDLIARQQITKAYNNLFPYGDLQERHINVLEYIVKFGQEFLKAVHTNFSDARYGEHKVIKC